jgi:DNA-binding response OmpR family regulator
LPPFAIYSRISDDRAPKGRILCTEDDTDTRDLLVFLLRNEGYDVTCSDNTEQTISLAKSQTFDLYLVDSWLSGGSGVTLTKDLREFDNKTPVLFYSGAAYESDKQKALNAGAQGYLVKPIAPEVLLEEVRRLIESAKMAYYS